MDRQKVLLSHSLMNFCSLSCLCQQRYQELLVEVESSCPFVLVSVPSRVLVNVQQSWASLAVKCFEGFQMERRDCLFALAGFLGISDSFPSELGCCYLLVRILNFVSCSSENRRGSQEHH